MIKWVASLERKMATKLASHGLIGLQKAFPLGEFLDSYIKMRTDVKDGTSTVYGHTRRCLVEFFGADKLLREITSGDAVAWRINLI